MQLSHHFSALISDHVIQSEKRFFYNSQTARDFRTLFTRSESKTFPGVARPQTDEGLSGFSVGRPKENFESRAHPCEGKSSGKTRFSLESRCCASVENPSTLVVSHFPSPLRLEALSPPQKTASAFGNHFEVHSIRCATVVPLVPFGFYRYSHV